VGVGGPVGRGGLAADLTEPQAPGECSPGLTGHR
jgi:hypothetical protein